MLPCVPDIGICETFGTSTVGKIDLRNIQNGSIEFDSSLKYSDTISKLSYVPDSKKVIWNKVFQRRLAEGSKKEEKLPSNNDDTLCNIQLKDKASYVDESSISLAGKFNKSNNLFSKEDFFDPCIGRMSEIFESNNKIFFAVSIGINNDTLAFGCINESWRKKKLLTLEQKELILQSNNAEQHQKSRRSNSVKFSWVHSIHIKSEIMQISIHTLNKSNSLVLVRCSDVVYVLRFGIVNDSYSLNKLFTFRKGTKWSQLSHCNIYVSSTVIKLVVVDMCGKFSVFESKNTAKIEFNKVKLKFESFYDPAELSNFKKSEWIDENRLILFSRTQLHEYRLAALKEEKFFCRISAGIWSKLLDVVPSIRNKSMLYILTTKEIILVDVSKSFKRKFAWKHYFTDLDTSLYLTIAKNPKSETETCIVASRQVSIKYALTVDINCCIILNNPYLILSDTNEVSLSISIGLLAQNCELYVLLEKSNNLEIALSLLHKTTEFDDRKDIVLPIKYPTGDVIGDVPNLLIENNAAGKLYNGVSRFYKFEDRHSPVPMDVTEKIYDEIENFMKTDIPHITLHTLVDNIHIPRNIKNISKIVEYIIKNDQEGELSFKINHSSGIYDLTPFEKEDANMETLQKYIRNILAFFHVFSDEELSTNAAFYLFLSSVEIWKTNISRYDDMMDQELKSSLSNIPDKYKNMINSFETDFKYAGIYDFDEDGEGYQTTGESNMNVVPSVSISQGPPVISTSQKRQRGKKSRVSSSVGKSGFSSQLKLQSQSQSQLQSQTSQIPLRTQSNSQSFDSISQKFSQTSTGGGFSQSQSLSQHKPKRKKRNTGF